MKIPFRKNEFIFRPRLFFLCLFSLLITGIAVLFFIRFIILPSTGLVENYPETVYYREKLIFTPNALFSPAVKGGLIPGRDQIIEVRGKPVTNTRELVMASYAVKTFSPFSIAVIRDQQFRLGLEISPQFTLMRLDWIFIFLLAALLCFTAFYLLIRFPCNLACNFLSLACIVYFLLICVKPFFYENLLSIILIHIGTFTPWLLVFFGLYYPKPWGKKAFRLGFIAAVVLAYVAFSIFRIYYIGQWILNIDEIWLIRFRSLGKYNNIANGIAYLILIGLLINAYRKSTIMLEKNLAGWFITGFIISISIYFCLEELPLILGEAPGVRIGSGNLYALVLIPIPIFALAGLRGTFQFKFKSIRTGIILSVLLLFFIFCFFFLLYLPIKNYLKGNNGLTGDLSSLFAMLILFILLFPLYAFLSKLIRRIFYHKSYRDLGEHLEKLRDENENLKMEAEQGKRNTLAILQQSKKQDLALFVKGLNRKIRKLNQAVKKPVMLLEQTDLFKQPPQTRETGFLRDAVTSLKADYIAFQNFLERLVTLFPRAPAAPYTVEMSYLLSKAVTQARRKFPGVSIEEESHAKQKLSCFPGEITLALENLLANACESGPGPGLHVIARGFREKQKYIIEIEDNGAGIQPLYEKQIFLPFFTTREGHDGLGLYLSRLNIEKNHGQIQFKNKTDSGSLFSIVFQTGE